MIRRYKKVWIFLMLVAVISLSPLRISEGTTVSAVNDSEIQTKFKDEDRFIDRKWCPQAQCDNSPICHPCHRRFLILLTTGRSASTTLTWMLDLLPGVRMSGENNNVIKNLMNMVNATTRYPFVYTIEPDKYEKAAWGHHSISAGAMACVSQKMVETINPPLLSPNQEVLPREEASEIVGFKTIRLSRNSTLEEIPSVVDFMKSHFPCARYIVNYRSDVEEQAASQIASFPVYYGDSKETAISRINDINTKLKAFKEQLGTSAYLLDASKWTKDVKHLNEAVEWLGFSKGCAFSKLFEFNTGRGTPGGSYAHGRTKLALKNKACRMTEEFSV